MGATLAVLSASKKTPCWNERFIKYARGCYMAWFLRILTGMSHGPNLLLWLRFFMSFSISVSLTGLTKNEFKTLFLSSLSKKLLNVSTIEVLFAIIFLSWNKEFGGFDCGFQPYNWFYAIQRFLAIFWISSKIILIILFFQFFYFRHYYFKFFFSCCAWLTKL